MSEQATEEAYHESQLVNGDRDTITNAAAQEFIRLIQEERRKGYGFVPFIGAGFSAPSGAPLVRELKSYLQRCICMALGAEDPSMEAWDPRTDQWPPFIDRGRPEPKQDFWATKVFNELIQQPNVALLAEGYGATVEWRTALLFLSRLVRPPRGTGHKRLEQASLAAPQQEIIDSCFREVLKGKHPALEQNILAVLAGALRLDLILTTNFDDLLERAFAAARNPLEVFEVHLGGSLPHWSAVSDVRSLIKLHGNRHSLRADYSLDEPPSEKDKKHFLGYLLSGESRSRLEADPDATNLSFKNHLLVMGFSAEDRRTHGLIEYAWERLNSSFRVFWLCYSSRDVERAQEMTRSFAGRKRRLIGNILKSANESAIREDHKQQRETPDPWQGSTILRFTNFGHLLLQLYQTIRKNLPPLGTVFPSASRLTLPPLSLPLSRTGSAKPSPVWENFCKALKKRLDDFCEPGFRRHKLIVAASNDGVRGVTSACSKVFQDIEADRVCLWLDMNDISSTDNLFEVLLEAAYFRLGLENWTPVYVAAEARSRAAEITRLVNSVNKPWVVFLNARESPGANTDEKIDPKRPHGWLDIPSPLYPPPDEEDPSGYRDYFLDLLTELCGPGSPRISVVLMCRLVDDPPPNENLVESIKQGSLLAQPEQQDEDTVKKSQSLIYLLDESDEQKEFSEEKIVADAIEWTAGDRDKRRFLHALVLMQRPRLLATIWSPAVSNPEIVEESQVNERLGWLDQLEAYRLVRRKAGGFIWIYARCRQKLRLILHDHEETRKQLQGFPKAQKAFDAWDPPSEASPIHAMLADWYGKVLDACEAPAAVFEIVYHLCKAAEIRLKGARQPDIDWAGEKLEAAAALLKANSFLIQTHGYSRGSCRRLHHIRAVLCASVHAEMIRITERHLDLQTTEIQMVTKRLQIVCTEVMRAIAREVGEDVKANTRHRQYGRLLASEPGKENVFVDKPNERDVSERVFEALQPFKKEGKLEKEEGEWLRWCRWSAMLGIASRSFGNAEEHLNQVLIRGSEIAMSCKQAPTSEPDTPRHSGVQDIRIEILRAKQIQVELNLLKIGLTQRRCSCLEEGSAEFEDLWRPASELIRTTPAIIKEARELASDIRGKDHSADSHITINANLSESRLLMHLSICSLHPLTAGLQGKSMEIPADRKSKLLQNAMGLLGDAEASLRISDSRRYRSELAMVELHRAEARLREAESVVIGVLLDNKHKGKSFTGMYRNLELREPKTRWDLQGEAIRTEFLGNSPEENNRVMAELRRARSLVDDSMRFLNRAEPVLRERRRNVWWTTWFFERSLRSIALSVWASVFETNTPIPFLGLEAAMRKTDTLADTLLHDAERMIRVDAYRFATILDAYASCAKALQMRLMLDTRSVRLRERQLTMFRNLSDGLKQLEEVHKRREPKGIKDDARLDGDVKQYVANILERCSGIAAHLSAPFD